MKLKANSKHKFDTERFTPSQIMRGNLNVSKLTKLAGIGNVKDAARKLNIGGTITRKPK